MKRPLLWYAGAYALGEVLILQGFGAGGLPGIAGGLLAAFFAAAGMAVVFYGKKKSGQSRLLWLALPLFFVLGYFRCSAVYHSSDLEKLEKRLAESGMEQAPAVVSGTVERIELRNISYQSGRKREEFRLWLRGCEIRLTDGTYPADGVLVFGENLEDGVLEGRNVTMEASVSALEEPGNPGQFDSKSYYRSRKISCLAEAGQILEVSGRIDYLKRGMRLLRQAFGRNLEKAAGEETAGLFRAMVLGEKWAAEKETVSLYEDCGIGHLLAISGLHISLVGMGVYRLFRRRRKGAYRTAALAGAAAAFCYYLLSGEGTSAARAFLMLSVYGAGQAMGRQYDMASAAAFSALLLLISSPLLLLQSGFLLSFGAVLGLGLLHPLLRKAELPGFLRPVLPGLSIQLMTLPVQAYFFYQIPVYSLGLNLLVLPLFTVVAASGMAGALLGGWLPGAMSGVLFPAGLLLRLYQYLGEKSLLLPTAVWRTGRPEGWQLAGYACLLLILCSTVKRRAVEKKGVWRGLSLVCLTGLLLCLMPFPDRKLEMTFLDVGQGDCCFVRIPEGITFLIDGGSSDEKQVGPYLLEPFLDCRAVGRVDFALISHGDSDHTNGICQLMELGRIGTLILPAGQGEQQGLAAMEEQAESLGIPVLYLEAGERLRVGEAAFTCLWPEDGTEKTCEGEGDGNGNSMVLWFSWRQFDVLFTGDLEGEGQQRVTEKLAALVKDGKGIEVLKVPHHGSKNSALKEFYEVLRPRTAVISVGNDNRYGHPHKETLECLLNMGTEVFRTDELGAVQIKALNRKLVVTGQKNGKWIFQKDARSGKTVTIGDAFDEVSRVQPIVDKIPWAIGSCQPDFLLK